MFGGKLTLGNGCSAGSWRWGMDGRLYILSSSHRLRNVTFDPVFQVHWLWAKAQKMQWIEELQCLQLKWSLQSGILGIKRNSGRKGGKSLILNHNQGMLHGQPNKAQCGVWWPYMCILHLLLCWRMTCLQNLLKSYSQIKHVTFFSYLCIVNLDFFQVVTTDDVKLCCFLLRISVMMYPTLHPIEWIRATTDDIELQPTYWQLLMTSFQLCPYGKKSFDQNKYL